MASKAWAIESVVAGRYDEDIVNAFLVVYIKVRWR